MTITKKKAPMKRTVINILSVLSDIRTMSVSEHSVRNYFSCYCKTLLYTNIFKIFSIFQVESTDLLFTPERYVNYILTLRKKSLQNWLSVLYIVCQKLTFFLFLILGNVGGFCFTLSEFILFTQILWREPSECFSTCGTSK